MAYGRPDVDALCWGDPGDIHDDDSVSGYGSESGGDDDGDDDDEYDEYDGYDDSDDYGDADEVYFVVCFIFCF